MLDSTLAFLMRGYRFLGDCFDRAGGEVTEVRLLLRRTVLLRGAEAARLVYDQGRFRRRGGMPMRVQRTLTGVGGVQGLDGEEHRARKALFVDLLDAAAEVELAEMFVAALRDRLPDWERRGTVSVLDECSTALCAAASAWVGLPAEGRTLQARTRALRAMIESPAKVGPAHWRGLLARRRAERAIAGIIAALRARGGATGTPLARVAAHRDSSGRLLPERVAAVEVLNLLRPVVAIARYISFAVHAAGEDPDAARYLEVADEPALRRYAMEVRRIYPFFPAVAAVAVRDSEFHGHRIVAGRRVLLDLWGTGRDGGQAEPDAFRPDRFLEDPGPFDVIPQGGGERVTGHRCPGEGVTVAVIAAALDVLRSEVSYRFAGRPMLSLRPIPTAPSGGMVLTGVRLTRPA